MRKVRLVIPMAGEGKRFRDAGYSVPKPFIRIGEKTLIEMVLDNLSSKDFQIECILIGRQSHLENNVSETSSLLERPNVTLKAIENLSQGSLCTILEVRELISDDLPLVVANSDQFVDFSFDAFLNHAFERELDGSILAFKDSTMNPKWSFAEIDNLGLVKKVAEKIAISEMATVGIYYFASGKQFVEASDEMISNDDRVNNEFYTCPVYNYLIRRNAKVGLYEIPFESMHGLGTPEDLKEFLSLNS